MLIAPNLPLAGFQVQYKMFAEQPSTAAEDALSDSWPYNVRPATDDRPPFFFQVLPLEPPAPRSSAHSPWAACTNMHATTSPLMELSRGDVLPASGPSSSSASGLAAAPQRDGRPPRRGVTGPSSPVPRSGTSRSRSRSCRSSGCSSAIRTMHCPSSWQGLLFATGIGAVAMSARLMALGSRGRSFIGYAFGIVVLAEVASRFPRPGFLGGRQWFAARRIHRPLSRGAAGNPHGDLPAHWRWTSSRRRGRNSSPGPGESNGGLLGPGPHRSSIADFSMTFGINAAAAMLGPRLYQRVGWLFPEGSCDPVSRPPAGQ